MLAWQLHIILPCTSHLHVKKVTSPYAYFFKLGWRHSIFRCQLLNFMCIYVEHKKVAGPYVNLFSWAGNLELARFLEPASLAQLFSQVSQ